MAKMLRSTQIPDSTASIVHAFNQCARRLDLIAPRFVPKDARSPSRRKRQARRARARARVAAGGANERVQQRRMQLEARLRELIKVFPVELITFAWMSNHWHLLLMWHPEWVTKWSDLEVVLRWHRLHPDGAADPDSPDSAWIAVRLNDADWIDRHRMKFKQLGELIKTWLQPLAQKWNFADKVTGAFFGKRFGSEIITNATHIAAVMSYIDLNEFAAGACESPEEAKHCGLTRRLAEAHWETDEQGVARLTGEGKVQTKTGLVSLKDLFSRIHQDMDLNRYLKIIDHHARIKRKGKKRLTHDAPKILDRLSRNLAAAMKTTGSNQAPSFIQSIATYLLALHQRHQLGQARVRLPAIE